MVLTQDIIDMIFLYCDWDTLNKTRKLQSNYVKNITEYNDMKYAALYGNFKNLKWLYFNGSILYHNVFEYSAKNTKSNIIEILSWLKEKKCPYRSETLYYNYMHIHIDILRWLNNNVVPFDDFDCDYKIVDIYINDTEFNLIKYLDKNNGIFTKDMYVYGIIGNNTNLIKWLNENNCPYDQKIFSIAIEFNNLEIINFFYKENYKEITLYSKYTTLETFKWLHKKEFYLSLLPYVKSVHDGDLDIIKFLYDIDEERWSYDHDKDIETGTLSIAIRSCNLETLQFLYKGYFYTHYINDLIIESIPNCNVGVLKFLFEIGCTCTRESFTNTLVIDIIKWDNVEMLKYLVYLGLELNKNIYEFSIEKKSIRVIDYLKPLLDTAVIQDEYFLNIS